MKASLLTSLPPPFTPVSLVLESQHEVDAFYAFLNHPRMTRATGLPSTDYKALQPYVNRKNSGDIYSRIEAALR